MNFIEKLKSIFIKKRKTDASEKKHSFAGINVKFSAETDKKRLQNEEELYPLIKEFVVNPEALINTMKKQGLKIYKIKNCEKKLNAINLEPGFIFPMFGLKALKINFLINSEGKNAGGFSLKTEPMFIFDKEANEIYTAAYALHKYYAFKSHLPGCDAKSQSLFDKTRNGKNKNAISKMNIRDVEMCKEAVARDIEAINFAIRISKEFAGAKNALNKMKSDNSAML